MNFSLRLKFIVLSTLLVTVIMATVTYFFSIRELEARRQDVEDQIETLARNVATMQLVDRLDWTIYQNYISQLTKVNEDIVYIAIFDDRQSLRANALNIELIDIDPIENLSRRTTRDIVRRLTQGGISSESQADIRSQTVNIQSGDRVLGSVQVGFSLIKINQALREKLIRNVLIAFLFLLLFGTISVILSQRLTKPLERLAGAMMAFEAGDLDVKVTVENRDEIGQLASTFNEMVSSFRERRIIEKLGQELGATFQLDRLSALVRDRVGGAIGASGARLFLRDREAGKSFHEVSQDQDTVNAISLDDKIKAYLRDHSDGLLIEKSPEFVAEALSANFSSRQGLVIPMLIKGELFGLLCFEIEMQTNQIDPKTQHFAALLANQAALALENSLLYDDLREQERLKHELALAREVQQKLLPTTLPKLKHFHIDGTCLPAAEIGGDYYDIFHIDDHLISIVIADVSGKGASAAFYMAEIKGMMMSLAFLYHKPRALLAELNRNLKRSMEKNVFASMIYGVLDMKKQTFRFARAGHNSLIYFTEQGDCELLTPPGIGLGLDTGKVFEQELGEAVLTLKKGDAFFMYTDGLTEAMNGQMEIYGDDRLIQTICSAGQEKVKDMRQYILDDIQGHVNGHDQHDDQTLVLVKYVGA